MRTLEQMLVDLNGDEPGTTKTAAAAGGEDLVDRLRKAAGVDPEPAELRAEAARELAEKTAEISVIALTLAEVDQALSGGTKTASVAEPTPQQNYIAGFIKMALEKGHSPDEIALFLHKEATVLGSPFERAGIALRKAVATPAKMIADTTGATIGRREQSILRNVHATGDKEKMGLAIERLRKLYPPNVAMQAVRDAGIEAGLKEHPSYKDLSAAVAKLTPAASGAGGGAAKHHLGVEVGGKSFGVSKATAEKLKMPAVGVAGLAVGRSAMGKHDNKQGGGGPVIITR